MTASLQLRAITLIFAVTAFAPMPAQLADAATPAAAQPASATILTREQAAAILPASVFFRGQSASIQARNSSGLRLPSGKLVLTTLVDTAGYSSALQQTYQAYLLTEVPILVGDRRLAPGAYGFGFLAGNKLIVMDLGGNPVLEASTERDEALPRPNPLQILPSGSAFRLYLGRSFATLALAPEK